MTTFLVIGGIGVVLMVVTLVLGEILDGLLEFDFAAGLESDVFSTGGIAGLLGGVGFGGVIGLSISNSMIIAIVVGIVVGLLLAFMAGRLTGWLRRQSSAGTHSTQSLVGVEAQVLTAIPADGYGQIRVRRSGHTYTLNAKSSLPLEQGTRVWIAGVLSATSVEVRPVDLVGNPEPPSLPS